ncbi:putative CCA tRNA nucleotidyltransferase 2 [Cucumis melo var. makuwa]|uniref:CCA tRNA nucleotidyltransferase 2 n=1 Tax=Cucumis melo var. makuwa TaxID=1194695 RepID=A0A5A7SQ51_CUCMM|nr:putative CCA tRNA nucleotidyltransferase 2 [Cucumis melo var. makuwa]TYK04440.1 putative CCA tRNA nucleotidyltransferase 2 [Cucumis melo var. makuwa]
MKLLFSLKLPLKLHSLIIPSLSIPTSLLKFSPPHPPLKFPTTRFPSPKSMATAMSSPKPLVQVKDNIELTETEEKIFHRLLGTLRHFNLQTQLRVAGGWVRDKLLGKDCYDIDIALDNMLGSEFVDKVREYLLTVGEEAQGVAVIPCNPDQSKHLETARMRIFDMWIDFVNLRCEEYSENRRIPTKQKFGTAEEDAYRRDLTINSLFYNINLSIVEDFTKRGISDLKFGKIVTPLPAKATFMDDPLRVLRAIRFCARFEFTLDEELKEAAACEEVKAALAAKISRERIGVEIDLMIAGNQPVKAMSYISDLTLFWTVFTLPSNTEPEISEVCNRLCIACLDATWNLIQHINCFTFSDEQKRLSLYASLFLPFRKFTFKDKKSKKIPVVNYIFRDSLKRKVSDAETVVNVHQTLEKFLSLIPLLVSKEEIQPNGFDWGVECADVPATSRIRVLTGLLLREIKDFWPVALLMATLLYPANVDYAQDLLNQNFELEKRKELFDVIYNETVKLGLENVWEMKPLVNGKEIMNILQLKAGGPLVREWQQKILAWQLAHPSGTSEECIDWIRETHSKRVKLDE